MLLERFDTFNGPPFTIQRLCELLSCPRKEYNRVDKFMRAVEKNILVVSTCELRSKREEIIVNGIPDQWDNGKESEINMDLVDKSSVITDTNVLNGNETVESLLNELESMKTPETKLDELKIEQKDDIGTQQATDEVKSELVHEEPKQDTQVLISDIPQVQITETIEVVEKVNTDIIHETKIDLSIEKHSEICEIQPIEVAEQIAENSVEKDIPSEVNIENVEQKIEEPIIESNKHSESIPADVDRVEGSIIHQTPDSDNKLDQNVIVTIATLQSEVVLKKSNEVIESMDIQDEDVVTKSVESEVNCGNVQEECTGRTEIENDNKQQDDKSVVDVLAIDTIPTEMDVESQKVETDVTQQQTVSVKEETKTTEPDIILEEPQEQAENKLTESE